MSIRERTRQQLDPAGTTGIRIFTSVGMICAFLYAAVFVLRGTREISNAPVAVLALACLATAVALVVIESSPYRAPLSRNSHLIIEGFVLLSVFLYAVSSWGSDAFVRDDWGPVVFGILFLAMGPYRPAREIAAAGALSSIFVGFLVLLETPWFVTEAPPLAFVLVAVAPQLAMCFGAAAYSLAVVGGIEKWQKRASKASVDLVHELRGGIARSVQQDRVTILGHDVLPFFSKVLAGDRITDADRERARGIARSIRDVMVAEADRSWLESVVELAGGAWPSRVGAAATIVDDRDRLASWMTTEQRTAVRALLVALVETPSFEREDLHIRLTRDGELCRVVVSARLASADSVPRIAFAPYFALIRSAFDGFDVDFEHPSLRLRFWYEQH